MKINTVELRNVLSLVGGAVSSRPSMPVLSGVIFDNGVVRASNLDQEIAAKVGFEGTPLKFCVAYKSLNAIAANVAGGDVEFTLKGNSLHIKSGDGKFRLPVMPVEEFPQVVEVSGGTSFSLPAGYLLELLSSVHRSALKDETRFIMNCVCLERHGNETAAIATDGRRLSYTKNLSGVDASVLLPLTSVNVLRGVLSGFETVKVTVNKGLCWLELVQGESVVAYRTKLIDGSYVAWRTILPKANNHVIEIDKDRLKSVVKRVMVAGEGMKDNFKMSFAGDGITISKETAEQEARDKIGIACPSLKEVGLNASFVVDALESCTDQVVKLHLADDPSNNAFVVVSGNASHIIMPIRPI